MKYLKSKGIRLTALVLILLLAVGAYVRTNQDVTFGKIVSNDTVDFVTSSTITSQNKFIGFDIGGQNWGQPIGRMLNIAANTTLTAADSGKIFTNDDGFSAPIVFTLPVPAPDIEYTFVVVDSVGTFDLSPLAGDVIRCDASATAAGADVTGFDTNGEFMRIVCVNADLWMCLGHSTLANLTFN